MSIYRELEEEEEHISSNLIISTFMRTTKKQKLLIEVFEEHNRKCRELLGQEYVLGTVLRYERTVTYLQEYLQLNYKRSDIPIKKIDHDFIKGFEHYIKSKKKCAQNATMKYLTNLKKIVKRAIDNGWITIDPFSTVKLHQKPSNRDFLFESEVLKIYEKPFDISRLEAVRDVFVFCCFTGLAFSDVKQLRRDHILRDENQEAWIYKARQKTDVLSRIPLLDIPFGNN